MGKGTGGEPPQKFIDVQRFFQFSIFFLIGLCLTLTSLSAGMDNGASFSYPYFLHGFVLAIIKHIWPWSCWLGILWSSASCILTGIGGVNCLKQENNGTLTTVINSCYYDVTTEQADVFKGMVIGLIVEYIASLVYLLLSPSPANSVIQRIKEDPAPRNTATQANNRPVVASESSRASTEAQMQRKIQQLEANVREIEDMERQARNLSVLPPPPSYTELMNSSGTGAHPDQSFPS